jgi:hypothetical protein
LAALRFRRAREDPDPRHSKLDRIACQLALWWLAGPLTRRGQQEPGSGLDGLLSVVCNSFPLYSVPVDDLRLEPQLSVLGAVI